MYGRNRGAAGVASDVIDNASPYVTQLADDKKLRRQLVAAASAGVAARRRARRQAGLLGVATQLGSDPVLRAQLIEAVSQLQRAQRRMKRRNTSHTTRNVLLLVTGAGLAAAVSPKVRTRVIDAVRGVNFAGMPGRGDGQASIEQEIEVNVPVRTAYNQWTQFEDWPEFMHRVTRVTKDDDCTVSFATKIWGKTKEFTAAIDTQRPDERIKWRVSQGITHTGVVTFHKLAPRLTRIEVNVDVVPGSLLEKAARGMRHIKRAMRADLHRFKAFIEMQELETGAWRGVIEDGELVEEHPEDYDAQRDYGDIEDATAGADEDTPDEDFERSESDDTEDEPEEPEAEEPDDTEDEPEEPEAEEPSRRAKTSGRRKAATDAS
jgi:uncharacterized membrane protein